MGAGVRHGAGVPAIIKGEEVYLDIEGSCTLVGEGILGENVTLITNKLAWYKLFLEYTYWKKYSINNTFYKNLLYR